MNSRYIKHFKHFFANPSAVFHRISRLRILPWLLAPMSLQTAITTTGKAKQAMLVIVFLNLDQAAKIKSTQNTPNTINK